MELSKTVMPLETIYRSMNRELTPKANEEPHCSKRKQEVIVREIMPSPEEKKNTRKRKTLTSKHLTLDENMSKAMRRLFQNNDVTDMSFQTQMASRTLT
jgi:hypothetical protein